MSEEKLKVAFSGLSEALGVDFEMVPSDSAPSIGRSLTEATLVHEAEPDGVMSDEDELYIDTNVRETIKNISEVMDTLEDDIKVGSEARKYEVYSALVTAKINAINSFRDLKLSKSKHTLEERKVGIREKTSTKTDKPTTVNNLNVGVPMSLEQLKTMTKELIGN